MSKKPAIRHAYDRKKDRFEIKLKHFSLKKKWLRRELLDMITKTLDQKSSRRHHGHRAKGPMKETRLEEVGD